MFSFVDVEFHNLNDADLDVEHSDTHTLPFKPCFFFRMDQIGSHLGAAPRQRVPHSCMSNSAASDVQGIIATVPGVEKCGLFFIFWVPRKLYLGCDIGGANELGVIYFPTNWGAKECQNLPKHRVGMQTIVFLCTVSF